MVIRCAACKQEIGRTSTHTLEQAILEHVCLASDQDYETALTWIRFNQIVNEEYGD